MEEKVAATDQAVAEITKAAPVVGRLEINLGDGRQATVLVPLPVSETNLFYLSAGLAEWFVKTLAAEHPPGGIFVPPPGTVLPNGS